MHALIWINRYRKWKARLACWVARLTARRSKFWAEITSIWSIFWEPIRTRSQTSMLKEILLRSYTGETIWICSFRTSIASAMTWSANVVLCICISIARADRNTNWSQSIQIKRATATLTVCGWTATSSTIWITLLTNIWSHLLVLIRIAGSKTLGSRWLQIIDSCAS